MYIPLLISMSQKYAFTVTVELTNPLIASLLAVSLSRSGPAYRQSLGEHLEVRRREEPAGTVQKPGALWCHRSLRWGRVLEEKAAVLMPHHTDHALALHCLYLFSSVPEWMRKAQANSRVRKLVTAATSGYWARQARVFLAVTEKNGFFQKWPSSSRKDCSAQADQGAGATSGPGSGRRWPPPCSPHLCPPSGRLRESHRTQLCPGGLTPAACEERAREVTVSPGAFTWVFPPSLSHGPREPPGLHTAGLGGTRRPGPHPPAARGRLVPADQATAPHGWMWRSQRRSRGVGFWPMKGFSPVGPAPNLSSSRATPQLPWIQEDSPLPWWIWRGLAQRATD